MQVFALLGAAAALSREVLAFEKFQQEFSKYYSDVEKETRFQNFRKNLAYVLESNARTDLSYTLEINEFSDMTVDEWVKEKIGARRPASLWAGLKKVGTHTYQGEELPSSVDWTKKGAVTPVKNQQQRLVQRAFSSTGSLEGANSGQR